jgi:hypothetical protein
VHVSAAVWRHGRCGFASGRAHCRAANANPYGLHLVPRGISLSMCSGQWLRTVCSFTQSSFEQHEVGGRPTFLRSRVGSFSALITSAPAEGITDTFRIHHPAG